MIKAKISNTASFLVLFILVIFPEILRSQDVGTLSTNQWAEDIDFLDKEIDKTVPGFTASNRYQQYHSQIEALKRSLSAHSRNEIVIALQEALNNIQDEGCRIYPFQERLNYKILPIKSYWFSDGIYIIDANAEYSSLIGKKIVSINETPIDSVYAVLKSSLNADNENYRKHLFPAYMQIPAWLSANGIGTSNDDILLSFTDGQTLSVNAEDINEYAKLNRNLAGEQKATTSKANFWMEYKPDQQVLFIQFLRIDKDQSGETFKKFVGEIENVLNKKDVSKLVIDNRYGGGGNGFKLKPFTDLIRDNKEVNQKGKLFVLTSRATRGTILELTSILELNTKAIVIGEPTGEGPNSVGDGISVELPNSKIRVSLTKKYWPTSWPEDKRQFISPNIDVQYSFKDYLTNIDPWMDKVFSYKQTIYPDPNIPEKLVNELVDEHLIQKRKVKIFLNDNKLYMSMERKMATFFEFYSQLYLDEHGRLATDIENVYLHYNTSSGDANTVTHIDWQGIELK